MTAYDPQDEIEKENWQAVEKENDFFENEKIADTLNSEFDQ